MSVNIKEILETEIAREKEILKGLDQLDLDDISKEQIRQRTYNTYKSVQNELELFEA